MTDFLGLGVLAWAAAASRSASTRRKSASARCGAGSSPRPARLDTAGGGADCVLRLLSVDLEGLSGLLEGDPARGGGRIDRRLLYSVEYAAH
ncbi:hypothetical protein ACWEQC_13620 [Streptomyces shenzhenensis]